MQLVLALKDVRMSQYPVKLKLTIESNQVHRTTSSDYQPSPIYLQGGLTQTLYG
jgi:hypothetical protein